MSSARAACRTTPTSPSSNGYAVSGKTSLSPRPMVGCAWNPDCSDRAMKQQIACVTALAAMLFGIPAVRESAPVVLGQSPVAAIVDQHKLAAIEALVLEDIAQKRLPGAVVLVGHRNRIVYQKAIGHRALIPTREPMTINTIFDLASLTKPIATTTSVMLLVEQGRIRLTDRVSTF